MTGPEAAPPQVVLTVDEAFGLGHQLHKAGLLASADELYRRILVEVPDHVDALHFRGVLCHQTGRSEEAAELLGRILSMQPDNADAHSNFGNVLQEQGRHAEAEAAYRSAIALRSDHASAYNNLGVVLAAQERFTEAVEAARKATELRPQSPDHHYNLGNALRRAGALEEAIEEYRRVLSLDPRHAYGRQSLGRALILAGRIGEAEENFREWLAREPDNPTAQHLHAALSGLDVPGRASDGYVQQLFDGLAGSFESHLSSLGYRAPALVADILARCAPEASADLEVLDAGCGTGLCGSLLRPYAKRLAGVDLSGGMLQKAAALGIYDHLEQAELTAYLEKTPAAFDLIVAADTLCYFGDLGAVLQATSAALRAGGLAVFTLEEAGGAEGPGFRLGLHGRYSHGRDYVEEVLAAVGLGPVSLESAVLRLEGGRPVAGLIVAARRAG